MLESPQLFGSLSLARHRNGSPIKLPRSQDEVVMLAFDQRNHRLVELHIVTGPSASSLKPAGSPSRRNLAPGRTDRGSTKPAGCRQVRISRVRVRHPARFVQQAPAVAQPGSRPDIVAADLQHTTCALLREAAALRSHSFMTLLEVGIDDGLPYYVTTLNDGEFIQEYVKRRGAMPTVTALALLHQLLQELGQAEEHTQLVPTMRLDRLLVVSPEAEHLQLRVLDYGLPQPASAPPGTQTSLVSAACQLLFLLLTGQACSGGNPDDFSVIAELPARLRSLLKSVLTRPNDSPLPIKTLRDEVREVLCSLVTLVQARNPKTLLVADQATLPLSHLQSLLLDEMPLETLFGSNFRIENQALVGGHPFTIPALCMVTDQPLMLHLLPPARIVSESEFMALPPQVWRQDPARQPNLLHMLSLWRGPDWAFISEVREPGMPLGSLMAKRRMLNPAEVILLLRQIHAGLEQALATGVERPDLDPAGMQLCLGADSPVLARDFERLSQKRLDAWPKFMVKLRLHKTMRSLCKPRLIDLSPWEYQTTENMAALTARDERHRCFIGVAAFLLTGEGRLCQISEFPPSMPALASAYLLECLQSVLSGGPVPSPLDFTNRLHHLLTASGSEAASAAALPAFHESGSTGVTSDFEEDWPAMDRLKEGRLAPVSHSLKTLDFNGPLPRKPPFPWLALAATLMLLGATAWLILGDLPGVPPFKFASSPPPPSTSAPIALPPPQPQHQPVIQKIPAVLAELPPIKPSPSPATLAVPSPSPLLLTVADFALAAPPPPLPPASQVQPPKRPLPETPPLAASAGTPPSVALPVPASTIRRAITASSDTSSAPAPGHPPTPAPATAAPPEQVAVLDAVTIRHAIIVSPEELQQTRRPPLQSRQRKPTRG